MKPIYFPFTYISEQVAKALNAYFERVVVYQPSSSLNTPKTMQKLAENGVIDIRIPIKDNEDKLNAIVKDYKTWANVHQASGMSFFKNKPNKIPFFDESYTQISADIKKQKDDIPSNEKQDIVFSARVFLQIAQEFDIQNWEVNDKLSSIEKMEQDLIKNLKGENFLREKKATVADNQSEYMIADRIKAWSYLLQNDQKISPVFVTNSKTAFEYLIDQIPVFVLPEFDLQDNFASHLDDIAKHTWQATNNEPIKSYTNKRHIFCIAPQKTPYEFFNHFTKQQLPETTKNFKNTIIGLVE